MHHPRPYRTAVLKAPSLIARRKAGCLKIETAQKDAQKLGGESVKGAALSPFRVQ